VYHPELGKKILDQVEEAVKDVGRVEIFPRIDGRNMTMVLAPDKRAQAAAQKAAAAAAAEAASDEPTSAPTDDIPITSTSEDEAPDGTAAQIEETDEAIEADDVAEA
jgi:translation initiation factor IF-3